MKVLVLGSSGFLGSYLGFALPRLGHEVFGTSRLDVRYFPKNTVLDDLDGVVGIIHAGDHDVVVNCVALASHEACEANPEKAEIINAIFPGVWASAAVKAGSKFVQISTDAVFDGNSSEPYLENDETKPQSVYGITKARGEQVVLATNSEALVLRVNFFGWSRDHTTGVLDFFINALMDGSPIIGFQDYVVSSLYMGHLAEAMMALVGHELSGTFHAVSSTPLSKFDFGQMVARLADLSADSMAQGLLPKATGLALRGHNLSLSTSKIEEVLCQPMPSTEAGLRLAFDERQDLIGYFGETYK